MPTENSTLPNLSPPPDKPWLTPETRAIEIIEAVLYELNRVQPARYNERDGRRRVLAFLYEKYNGGPGRKPKAEGGK